MQLPKLPVRKSDAHKGDFGKVLLIAGSRNMVGAACLATLAALKAGAGLVTLATSESAQILAAPRMLSALTQALPETQDGSIAFSARETIKSILKDKDVLAIGPGLSRNPDTEALIKRILAEDVEIPVIIDADALNAISSDIKILDDCCAKTEVIITPHPGELARLVGLSAEEIQKDRLKICREFVNQHQNIILVLKGFETIVISKNAEYVNLSGNPGMATGGVGDVLTGLIAGLHAQKISAFESAVLAVYLHGLAGDFAAHDLTQFCLTAEDLLDYLPFAFKFHLNS